MENWGEVKPGVEPITGRPSRRTDPAGCRGAITDATCPLHRTCGVRPIRGRVMRRVVISGVGVVAPNGVGKDAFWDGCVDGHSGIGPIRSFDASNHPIRVAGEVHDFDPEPYVPAQFRKSVKVMGRAARFGIGAAGLAVSDAALDLATLDPERFGVVMGAGLVPMDLGELAPLLARAARMEASSTPPVCPIRTGRTRRSFRCGCSSTYPTWPRRTSPWRSTARGRTTRS